MAYLLEDIKVIDAASFLAAPGAATVMADYGADVIKIEPPTGDMYRTLVGRYPVPYHWQLTSRNKRSVGLDLTQEAGWQLLHRLVVDADVFISNHLPAQLARFHMDYETLKALNPRLIFAHLSGYGLEGDDAERRAFDVTGWWARSGMMELIRDPGQTPLFPAPGMGDHSSAMTLFGAIMTGLYRREKTGEGCQVDTSLLANGVWANAMALQGVIAGNDLGEWRQENSWNNPFSSAYKTKDGCYVMFSMINAWREWPGLTRALDCEHWQQDPRFGDIRDVMKHRDELKAMMAETIIKYDRDAIEARLSAEDITYSPVTPMRDVIEDPQLLANNIVIPTGDPGDDYRFTISSPMQVRGEPKKPPKRAPEVGAHNVEVLSELGLSDEEITGLVEHGVIVL